MSSMSLSSPCMSDKTILMSVEDLINVAMGSSDRNTVDFKMVQTVLHILARQMRLLEQKVVLVAGDLPVLKPPKKDGRRRSSDLSEDSRDSDWNENKGSSGSRISEGKRGTRGMDRHGRDKSRGRRGRDDDEEERGGRRRRSRGTDGDDREGSRGKRGDVDYDDEREGRGRSKGRQYDDDEGRRGRSKSRGRYADDDDDEKVGRGRSRGRHADDEEHGRGGPGSRSRRGRDGDDEIEDERGGRGRSRGRYSDDEEDGRGGHGRSRKGRDDDEDERGGRGRSRGRGADDEDYDDEKGGHGRSRGGRDDDEDERSGHGRSRGRGAADEDYDDEKGGHGKSRRGRDKDDAKGGHGRSRGGRFDDEDGSRGRGGSGGRRDREHEEGSRESEDSVGRGRHREGKKEPGSPGGRSGKDYAEGGSGTRGKGGRGKEGIGIREVDGPGQDKLLVVVKSPTSVGPDRERRDSIAVVTQSQFRFLIDAVDELRKMAGPLPALTLPDNMQLRKELAAGASLTDTMQAMQVEARVKAAEAAIGKLGGLLTQLAASGALPRDALAGAWGRGTDAESQMGEAGAEGAATKGKPRHVTEPELGKALKSLRDELTKELQAPIKHAATAAEAVELTAKTMGAKVEELLQTAALVTELQTTVEDYARQLDGFDAGLSTQMTNFKEQITTMRSDLQSGMVQLDAANNNAETVAVMELNERYEELVRGLEDTLLLHNVLTTTQHQLTLELKSLVERVEMLQEQKADRDELIDGLRDKADLLRLEGLVRSEEFDRAREELDRRIDVCHDKFLKQDEVWRDVVRDLEYQASSKALVVDLMKLREEVTAQLRGVDDNIRRLELLLGEPETAMLMRALSRGAVCGACLAPALMGPGAPAAPPALPAARAAPPPPPPPHPPAAPARPPAMQPDLRTHKCHRWVGGSHTLLTRGRIAAPPLPVLPDVTRKYTDYGTDGHLYQMETSLEPCVECNPAPTPTTARSGAGAGDADDGLLCACSDTDVK